jgi:transposase
MAKYSYELKLSVVEYYLLNKAGYRSTSNKFQVGESLVRKWIALTRLHGAEELIKKPNAQVFSKIQTFRHRPYASSCAVN